MTEQEVGKVTHYFSHLGVAAVQLTGGSLALGDTIHIKGHTSDLECRVEAMQLEHAAVQQAGAGQNIGIKVPAHVREHDKVFKIAA